MRIILDYYIGKCKENPDMLSQDLLQREELTSLREADLRRKALEVTTSSRVRFPLNHLHPALESLTIDLNHPMDD